MIGSIQVHVTVLYSEFSMAPHPFIKAAMSYWDSYLFKKISGVVFFFLPH